MWKVFIIQQSINMWFITFIMESLSTPVLNFLRIISSHIPVSGKATEYTIRVPNRSAKLSINVFLIIIEWYFVWDVHGFKCNLPVIFLDFNDYWIFSKDLLKPLQIIYIKISPPGEDLFHTDTQTDGRTDRQNEAKSPFSQFIVRF